MASDKIEYSRLLIKRSNVSGEIPTVPPVSAVTLNQFTTTDIFVGEFFANVEDETLYFRTNTGIVEIAVSGSTGTTIPSLVQVLNQGNTTGGFDVEVSSGNTIVYNGLTSGVTATYLGLDASGNTITTVGGSGQNLESTLGFGNTTGANDIIFTQGYKVEGALGYGYLEPEGSDESITMAYITTGATGSVNINEDTLIVSYNNGTQTSTIETDGNYISIGNGGGGIEFVNTGATSGITIEATTGYPLYINNLATGTSVNSLALNANNRLILAPVIGATTIGTSLITSGTTGRLLFEGAGNVFQQDSQLFWDNTNKGLGVGATPDSTVKLDVRADSALSTDLAFRVRDNTNSFNIIEARNNGDVYVGAYAGYQNTGSGNSFFGQLAGVFNTTGINNSYFGNGAGRSGNVGGARDNSCFGQGAGFSNTSGGQNTFIGRESGYSSLSSTSNSHFGYQAGYNIESGENNISMGYQAGMFIGTGQTSGNSSSNDSIFIGTTTSALSTGQTNQIVIGHNAKGLGSNTALLGNSSITKTLLRGDVVLIDPARKFGYDTGAGGTVTQATSKSTGVTLNRPTGQITMNAAALSANTTVSFTLTNSVISVGDILVLQNQETGTAGAYTLGARTDSGTASIAVRNVTSGSLSEAMVIAFAVIKSVTT